MREMHWKNSKKLYKFHKNFIKTFRSDYQNIFFYGTVGTGKSFLSCCIAKDLMDCGNLVLYFSASQLFDTLSKSMFDKDSKEALFGISEDIYGCDLLIIDDLGTELTNAFVSSQLFSCLNNRHLRKKRQLSLRTCHWENCGIAIPIAFFPALPAIIKYASWLDLISA